MTTDQDTRFDEIAAGGLMNGIAAVAIYNCECSVCARPIEPGAPLWHPPHKSGTELRSVCWECFSPRYMAQWSKP